MPGEIGEPGKCRFGLEEDNLHEGNIAYAEKPQKCGSFFLYYRIEFTLNLKNEQDLNHTVGKPLRNKSITRPS
jgi:hypothetical protein